MRKFGRRWLGANLAALSLASAGPASLTVRGQEAEADSAAAQERETPPDSVLEAPAADSVQVRTFPLFPQLNLSSQGLMRLWGHEALLATGAFDLGDILEFNRWMTPVRAGFVEGPKVFDFAGSGSVSLRYTNDGYDFVPLGSSGTLDTHLITLAELSELTLRRDPGGFEVVGQNYRRTRPEAYSRVEGGAGDRGTNLIRAVFAADVFSAPMGFAFDRLESRGSNELGGMIRNTIWANVAVQLPADSWGQLEYRRISLERDSLLAPDRTDLILRLRRPFFGGWTGDVIAGRAVVTEKPGGLSELLPDSLIEEKKFSANQVAVRAARSGAVWSAMVSLRAFDGDGVPNLLNEAAVDLEVGPASLFAKGRWEDWDDFTLFSGYAASRITLPLGFQILAEAEDGGRGLIGGTPVPLEYFTRVSVGAGFSRGAWQLRATGGRWRVQPSPGLGAPFDSAAFLPGGTVTVYEASGTIPVFKLFKGQITAGGFYQTHEEGLFLYWPDDQWYVEGRYDNPLVGGQLEFYLSAIGGFRSGMFVPDAELGPSLLRTSSMNWFRAEIVIRILSAYIFYNYESFDTPEDAPFDLPGFPLPRSRTHFGLKWEFWN